LRADIVLRQKYKVILSSVGAILLIVSGLMLSPLITLFFRPSETWAGLGFLVPALILALTGICLWRLFRPSLPVVLSVQEGGVIVLLSWVVICLASAWPFVSVLGLNFTQAFFEAVSGWTTTGLSVVDLTAAPYCILLWRSTMQLIGGAGFAIIMLAAITGPVGPALPAAEGRSEQLAPHVRKSARLVLSLYAGYAVIGVIAYKWVGLSFFDAVNHAFAAISTGGFSTRVESIGFWNSPAVEGVTLALMVVGNMNFLTSYLILRGRFRAASRNGELRLFTISLFVSFLLLFIFVCSNVYSSLGKSLRVAIFEAASALTTTGFSTTVYVNWGTLGFWVLILLMIIGGGTGSTAGGIKQYRVYLLYKSLVWEIRSAFLPRTAVMENSIWQGERKDYITASRISQVTSFVFLYLLVFVAGTGVLAAYGYDLKNALFEFASAVGTVGLSIGITSATAPPGVLWAEIIGMFLGRLEFFVVFVSLGKIIRDIYAMSR